MLNAMYQLNHRVAFKEKKGQYAVYVQYHLYFFSDISARFFEKILQGKWDEVPEDFIEFLKTKKIIGEQIDEKVTVYRK